jgi:hypothetical protein
MSGDVKVKNIYDGDGDAIDIIGGALKTNISNGTLDSVSKINTIGTLSKVINVGTVAAVTSVNTLGGITNTIGVNISTKYMDNISTTSQKNISHPHHEIHDGKTYRVNKLWEDVADDAIVSIAFKNHSSTEMHFSGKVTCEGKAYVYLFENPTLDTLGTLETPINMRRSSSNVSNASAYSNSDYSTGAATEIDVDLVPGGTGPFAVGGEVRGGTEFIFNTASNYILTVQNKAGSAKDININTQWYEK